MKVLLSLLFALYFLAIESFFITELFDVNQVESSCVADYLNIGESNQTFNDVYWCNEFKKSIPKAIEKIIEEKKEINCKIKNCAVNLVKSYNITTVIFKALAYHKKLIKFTTNSQESCEDIVKFNSTLTEELDMKVLTVESIGVNKSFVHLKHCLNDLFHEFKADKIAFHDSDGGEISNRLFGKHFVEFLEQISMMGVEYCKSNENIVISDVQDVAGIDLFGITEPSRRVEKCIIEEVQDLKNAREIALILFNKQDENFTLSRKKLIEISLDCLKEF